MEDLKKYFIEKKNGSRLKAKSLKKENVKLFNEIINFSEENNLVNLTFKEIVWLFVNEKKEPSKCLVCGNTTKFDRFSSGYRQFCSSECKSNSDLVKEKIKNTFEKKYGGHPMKNDSVKRKVEGTNLIKYGYKSHLKSEKIKNKIEETNLKKYGVKRPLQSKEIVEKTKNTMLLKYGVEHGLQSETIHEKTTESNKKNNKPEDILKKVRETNILRYGDPNYNNKEKNKKTCLDRYNIESVLLADSPFRKKIGFNKLFNSIKKYKHGGVIKLLSVNGDFCDIECMDCGGVMKMSRHFLTIRGNDGRIICTNCNPYGNLYSNATVELEKFLSKETILKNDRKTLQGKEIDILIPNKSIGIEYNGLYWHSEIYKDKNYHLDKTNLSKQKNINLIHIFEDEWINKEAIVKSIINNLLGVFEEIIYARKCEIKEISPKESREFLEKNHIQGNVNARVKLGLFYNNELVSVMTFGGSRKALGHKSKEDSWEMLRFCNKLNTKVIGGASKLFKYFIKKYNPKEVTSYSDNRYFSGELYKKLGFQYVKETPPNYWYVIQDKRFHRYNFRKDKLVKEGFDPNKTERQIMLERGIYRIYDCGNKKWVINFAN